MSDDEIEVAARTFRAWLSGNRDALEARFTFTIRRNQVPLIEHSERAEFQPDLPDLL